MVVRYPVRWAVARIDVYGVPGFSTETVMENCPEYDRLHAQVENVLGNLAQTTALLLELFRSKDVSGVHRLDKELELTVGEKERCIGALRQHVREHKCQDGKSI
jgi:hypothetical protein